MSYSVGHDYEAKARTADVAHDKNVSFSDLLLSANVLSGLTKARFYHPSPIQLKAIPFGRCGLDLIVQAKSGTGKTCVFTVIALEGLYTETQALQAIVLAPTREIAVQIEDVMKAIGQDIKGFTVQCFIGGRPLSDDKIKAKQCQIAVGTPGRILHLIEVEILKCSNVRLFILDEADKLLQQNFQSQINLIYSLLPTNKQMIAASATYPEKLADFVTRYMQSPTFVRLDQKAMALLGIKQYYYQVPEPPDTSYSKFEVKVTTVVKFLESYSFTQALIFSNYHSHAKDLADALCSVDISATFISGNLEQEQRLEAINMLKDYKCKVLISTDLTSRGIDASNVDLVVNLDVPKDWETYMHRTGRAGRFGSFGTVISFVTAGMEQKSLFEIVKFCGISLYVIACVDGCVEYGKEPVTFESLGTVEKKKKKKFGTARNSNNTSVGTTSNSLLQEELALPHQTTPQSLNIEDCPKVSESNNSLSEESSEDAKISSLPSLMFRGRRRLPVSAYSYSALLENFSQFKCSGVFTDLGTFEPEDCTSDTKETDIHMSVYPTGSKTKKSFAPQMSVSNQNVAVYGGDVNEKICTGLVNSDSDVKLSTNGITKTIVKNGSDSYGSASAHDCDEKENVYNMTCDANVTQDNLSEEFSRQRDERFTRKASDNSLEISEPFVKVIQNRLPFNENIAQGNLIPASKSPPPQNSFGRARQELTPSFAPSEAWPSGQLKCSGAQDTQFDSRNGQTTTKDHSRNCGVDSFSDDRAHSRSREKRKSKYNIHKHCKQPVTTTPSATNREVKQPYLTSSEVCQSSQLDTLTDSGNAQTTTKGHPQNCCIDSLSNEQTHSRSREKRKSKRITHKNSKQFVTTTSSAENHEVKQLHHLCPESHPGFSTEKIPMLLPRFVHGSNEFTFDGDPIAWHILTEQSYLASVSRAQHHYLRLQRDLLLQTYNARKRKKKAKR